MNKILKIVVTLFFAVSFGIVNAITSKTATCNKESQSLSNIYDFINNVDFVNPLDALTGHVFIDSSLDQDNAVNADERLYFFSGNGIFSKGSGRGEDRDFENRIAECTLTHEEKSGPVVQTLYLPLKDAEAYARRVESLVDGTSKIRFANNTNEGESNDDYKKNVQFKCKTITMDDETKKCSTCVYAEVLVPKKHVRYGHFGNASILECINGYDNNLQSSNQRPYFVQSSSVNYHPICIA